MRHLVFSALVVMSLAACDNPNKPDDEPRVGTWRGSISDTQAGSGTLRLTIARGTFDYGGVWSVAFTGGQIPETGYRALLDGEVLRVVFMCPGGGLVFLGLNFNGAQATGSYSSPAPCLPLTQGTVALTRD